MINRCLLTAKYGIFFITIATDPQSIDNYANLHFDIQMHGIHHFMRFETALMIIFMAYIMVLTILMNIALS